MKKENKSEKKKTEDKSEVLQRLAQASVEGLAIEVAMNTIIPGSGVALNGLRQGKNLKKVAKAMGKGAGKEGVEILDGENNDAQDKLEELGGDIALEFLTRTGGR